MLAQARVLPLEKPQSAIAVNGPSFFDWAMIVFGGLPFYLPFLLWMGERKLSSGSPIYWYVWMSSIASAPHVYSTYCRVQRKISEKRISFVFGWPAFFACVFALFFASYEGYFVHAMTFVNVVQSFHYLRQGYGVHKYFDRTNHGANLERPTYWAFHLGIPLLVLGRWDVLYTVWQGKPSTVIIPVHFSTWIIGAGWFMAATGILLGLFCEWRKRKQLVEKYQSITLFTLLSYYLVHIYGFLIITHYQRGFFAVTIFHAIQYLALLWVMETKSDHSRVRVLSQKTNLSFGFFLFWGLLGILGYLFEFPFMGRVSQVFPILGGCVMGAVSAHHYLADAVIWRRKAGI